MVVEELLNAGHEPVIFSRSPLLPLGVDEKQVSVVAGSTLELDQIVEACKQERVTGIIHLAAALIAACERDALFGFQTNVIGSLNVFEAARRTEIDRVVYTSGKGVYGALEGEYAAPTFSPVPESYTGEALHVYGATKQATEIAAAHAARVFGMTIIGLRLGSTFGPGKGASGDGYPSLKPRIIDAALQGTSLDIPYAHVVDDLVYNRDVASAHVLALTTPQTSVRQNVYNISGGQLVSIQDFVSEVLKFQPSAQLHLVEPYDMPSVNNTRGRLDISAAARDLGFAPSFPGVAGVGEYLQLQQNFLAR